MRNHKPHIKNKMTTSDNHEESQLLTPGDQGNHDNSNHSNPAVGTHGNQEAITIKYNGLLQHEFNEKYGRQPERHRTFKSTLSSLRRRCQCSKECAVSTLRKRVPVVDMFMTYRFKEYILGDLVSGVSTAILQVPQSMGYSLLASLPPIIGLYTSFVPVLVYFVFGRSRHLSVGTMALASLIITSAINKQLPGILAEKGLNEISLPGSNSSVTSYNQTLSGFGIVEEEKIKIAMTVSLLAGIFLTAASFLRLGIFAAYISEPFIGGFIAATNIEVLAHQLKHILGITVGRYSGPLSLFKLLRDICLNIPNTNIATLVTSIIAIIILFTIKKFVNERFAKKLPVPIPVDIIVVIIATIISHFCLFEDRFNVRIIKEIPQGLPKPTVPKMSNAGDFLMDGVLLGIVNFILNIMMVEMFAQKHDYPTDGDQEMFAAGVAGTVGSFFSSMAPSTSPPRCILSEAAGGRTQLAQLVSAICVLLTLLFLAPLLEALPLCILASQIVVSCVPLFRYYAAFVEYWTTSKMDFCVWLLTLLATMLIGVDLGMMAGLAVSIVSVVARTQRPYSALMAKSSHDSMLLDAKKHPSSTDIAGIKIICFEAPIYFATLEIFKNRVFTLAVKPADLVARAKQASKNQNNGEVKVECSDQPENIALAEPSPSELHAIIIDCSSVSFVDTSGAKLLGKLKGQYGDAGVQFCVAAATDTVTDTLSRVTACDALVTGGMYPSVYDAVVCLSKAETRRIDDGRTDTNV